MSISSQTELINFKRNFAHEIREVTVPYYSCPVEYCNKSNFTILELIQHLKVDHYRPTVARACARLLAKLNKMEREAK